jgi:hypothetical protein
MHNIVFPLSISADPPALTILHFLHPSFSSSLPGIRSAKILQKVTLIPPVSYSLIKMCISFGEVPVRPVLTVFVRVFLTGHPIGRRVGGFGEKYSFLIRFFRITNTK